MEEALKRGHEVLVVDNLSTGNRAFLEKDVPLKVMDVRDEQIHALFEAFQPEGIIHLAAQVSVPHSVADPSADAQINILGTLNILKAMKALQKRPTIVFASSAAIYGEPQYLPIDEVHPKNPTSPYGLSKWTAEKYIELWAKTDGISFMNLRFANVYGPRQGEMQEGGVVAKFLSQMKAQKECVIYGDGRQTRDFVYVKDVAKGVVMAAENPQNEALNIGTGKPITVDALYEESAKSLNVDAKPLYGEKRTGDIVDSYFDVTKAKQIFEFEAQTQLPAGILKIIQG